LAIIILVIILTITKGGDESIDNITELKAIVEQQREQNLEMAE
jgi:hypothetical protein